ncbi:MAG: ethanolamine ammonia-lyase [Planctomycetes bacterium]|nr:ethanolamine ammonia-lyase [Planctomycetota bacterium]MCH9724849.1 ethanolamine ammonia-lyase [Planctomycetota bacterium]MCH9778789.1 ethanolamine ammonia-lyase [Planctomycetota bacterium]MCH9793566.1 ethanolamine ammonia-lyase [Planctomycetota bacterium]
MITGPFAITLSLAHAKKVTAKEQDFVGISIAEIREGEDLFSYIQRVKGGFDPRLYRQILGAANAFKEGDQFIGVAATDEQSRTNARRLLSATRIHDINVHPVFEDKLHELLVSRVSERSSMMTLGQLKQLLLTENEQTIKKIASGLSSDVIGSVVKLMDNQELIAVGSKVFNSLPNSQIGARGYLGARLQPNSPTDNLDDIFWQVLDGWSYGVGDVVLGTNPVSSEPESVRAIELLLKDLLVTFGIEDILPHCVLSHIDVQAEVERQSPGSTALWFQSIAGSDDANKTFDISLKKMRDYARSRTGQYGLYFETGQGADFTNGHSHGFDMVLHESRKYGFARVLSQDIAAAQKSVQKSAAPWVHLNDVAGFIGPEVFRTREQLVRCCLEDIVMGKLHGLTIGLDVCSTLHMDVSLEDLDWCLNQIMPANPAYLMALPTKIDPMLGYLTTGFQDHVHIREKFGYRVNDAMWSFFQKLAVIDANGKPTKHFGDPSWVYLQYRRKKGDRRTDEMILNEGRKQLSEVRSRGVFVAQGHGEKQSDLEPSLKIEIDQIYQDAKKSIWAQLTPDFISNVPDSIPIETQSTDRLEYILHPSTGEQLSKSSIKTIQELRKRYDSNFDVQIVISDGLNALSIMDEGQLEPFLKALRQQLQAAGFRTGERNLIVQSGRVRAGYRIGELLFGGLPHNRSLLHIIGERPGTGHHTFSVYMTSPPGSVWGQLDQVDHNITKVVSGIAVTALKPDTAADDTVRILKQMNFG